MMAGKLCLLHLLAQKRKNEREKGGEGENHTPTTERGNSLWEE